MNKYFTKTKLCCYASIGILYFLTTSPFAAMIFPDGYSELRLTGLLPMAAGMLFGFPGALSCAIGNLVGDLYRGFDVYSIFGFFGNFLMAWMPYKLWHTLFFIGEHKPRYLNSMYSMFKFVAISVIGSCISVGTIAAGGQLLRGFMFGEFFLPVGLQYYDLSLIGGMLILQIGLTVFRVRPHIPEKVYQQMYLHKHYILDYVLAGGGVLICGVLIYLTSTGVEGYDGLIATLCVLLLAFTAVLAIIPMTRGTMEIEREEMAEYTGMRSQFVTVFLVLLCLILIIVGVGSYRMLMVDFRSFGMSVEQIPVIWIRILLGLAGVGTVLIIVLGILLQAIQRKVVEPVDAVTDYTRKFVSGEKLTDEKLKIASVGNELDVLGESVNRMADNIRDFVEEIHKRTVKEERMAAELSIARDIQQGMLPTEWTGNGFELEPYIRPAKEVGGDFYHFVNIKEDCVFVCIADVSGKDISAAMFMVQAKILIEAACHLPPNEMLAQVNDILSKANKAMLFVTAFAAVIDKKERRMIYANAGHNPPICLNNGETRWLDDEEPDFVLGAISNIGYRLHHLDIKDDFKLFIYTDGVNEAENKDGGFVGNERLLKWVEQLMEEQVSCEVFIKRMESHIDLFTDGADQSDDITMLVLTVEK